jgi:hypothetical protein
VQRSGRLLFQAPKTLHEAPGAAAQAVLRTQAEPARELGQVEENLPKLVLQL